MWHFLLAYLSTSEKFWTSPEKTSANIFSSCASASLRLCWLRTHGSALARSLFQYSKEQTGSAKMKMGDLRLPHRYSSSRRLQREDYISSHAIQSPAPLFSSMQNGNVPGFFETPRILVRILVGMPYLFCEYWYLNIFGQTKTTIQYFIWFQCFYVLLKHPSCFIRFLFSNSVWLLTQYWLSQNFQTERTPSWNTRNASHKQKFCGA